MTTTFEALARVSDSAAEPFAGVPVAVPGGRHTVTEAARVVTRPVPVAIEFVGAEEAADLIQRIERELDVLRDRFVELDAEADAAETRLDRDGVRADVSLAMAVGLRRFLGELRDEAEEERLALVGAAQVEAAMIRRATEPRSEVFDVVTEHWSRLAARTQAASPVPPDRSWRPPPVPQPADVAQEAAVCEEVDTTGAAHESVEQVAETPTVVVEATPAVAEPAVGVDRGASGAPLGEPAEDFWAAMDAADSRRDRLRRRFGRTGLLRGAAVACVAGAAMVHFV